MTDPTLRRVLKGLGAPSAASFKPDPFQLRALAATTVGDCLVTVPTGAGKTWIAVQAIASCLNQGQRAWYACPLKALSNDKYREFQIEFGKMRVGILTGDRKENPDAPVIVGTTEILRNQVEDALHTGACLGADFIVLDEAHYLGDRERGVVWEEVMIYLPRRIPLLLLSATIGNPEELAAWLQSIRGCPCQVVKEKKRPVPIFHLFFHPEKGLLPLFSGKGVKGRPQPGITESGYRFGKHPKGVRGGDYEIVLNALKEANLLPAIFFLKSRADCDTALRLCRHYRPIAGCDADARLELIERHVALQPHLAGHGHLSYLKHQAIGAHHAGQLPGWRLLLENLMNQRVLDAVFATSTVAAGVNFPARTVVFFNSDRFNGEAFAPLSPTEFHQMTGRAGRRGMDRIGFTLAVPGRYMDMDWVATLATSQASNIESQIQINFSMTLNLLLSHTPDQVIEMLGLSLASFQARQSGGLSVMGNLERQFSKHFGFLSAHGYVNPDGSLTEDGKWASRLRTDQPLLIAEGLRRHWFPVSSPSLLAAIVSALMNEKESDEGVGLHEEMDNDLMEALLAVVKGLRPFVDELIASGFEARSVFPRPAMAVCQWARMGSWERVCDVARMAEGDFAMLVLRTADCLRHIENLREVFPMAARSAKIARFRIMREPVVEEIPIREDSDGEGSSSRQAVFHGSPALPMEALFDE